MILRMVSPALSRLSIITVAIVFSVSTSVLAQDPEDVTGEAILEHPAGQLAVKAAELLTAGKTDAVIALGTKAGQDEWRKTPAEDRKGIAAMQQKRAPAPAMLSEAIRKGGVLSINGDFAVLRVDLAKGDAAIAYFEREAGTWRLTNGPMVIAGAAEPANEERVEGAALLEHPVAALVVQYVELVHAGKVEDAIMRLGSSEAQEQWKSEPASERAESAAYRKKTLPSVAELKALLPTGVLIIEDGERATLNVIKKEQRATQPGTVEYSSTTVAIPFVLENGAWKLAR
jgi:hypothetical protein